MDSSFQDQMAEEAELRNAERVVNQRRRRVREPQRIADVVSRLLARRGYAQVSNLAALERAWQDVAGIELATHSRPARLRRGILDVHVRNSATLQELSFNKRRLLQNLQQIAEGKQIRDLRFRIGSF